MYRIEFSGKSDVGSIRSNNEDIYAIDGDAGYCLVADGMGGAAAGEMASQIFARTAGDVFTGTHCSGEQERLDFVHAAFKQANDRILEHVRKFPEHLGMGCTAELLVFAESGYIVGHMGDSRTYRLREGEFKQLTKDHSLVQEHIDQGLITAEQARSSRMRNIILRAVGVRPSFALDTMRGPILPGDLFLLCSDGLTDLVEDHKIQSILMHSQSLSIRTEQLIESAIEAGGKDNITVVLAEIK